MGKGILIIRKIRLFLSVVFHRIHAFLTTDNRLHQARFARIDELIKLLSLIPPLGSLLLGNRKTGEFTAVSPTENRRELGNLLVVAPTRGGKGLLAVSQLLTWKHSVIVNDIKGDLFTQTAGYRSTLGKVFVIDPQGYGHRFDPLHSNQTEDEFFSSASHLLFQPDEGEGRIFTQRGIVMLAQMCLGSRIERIAPLPYIRFLMRLGLPDTAAHLNTISPELATQFLDVPFEKANFTDRFLLSAWGTLTARMRPLLTETVVRSLTHSDFTPGEILRSEKPITVYLRWSERDLLALSPLVRLLWGSFIDELITTYDRHQGEGCYPILLLIDEAGRTAIPMLADHATTVAGRGISLWIAVQSLSQLETVYGKARATTMRENMETQIYYRPADMQTAKYLEDRLGTLSAYAHSKTIRDGQETSEGRSERPIPLLSAQAITQLKDEEIIGFHRNLPPFRAKRMDWRQHALLRQRQQMIAPTLSKLPPLTDIKLKITNQTTQDIIDPDELLKDSDKDPRKWD